ncbi:ribosome biogenesis protein BRX1, partial [Skeletonema marinoi]
NLFIKQSKQAIASMAKKRKQEPEPEEEEEAVSSEEEQQQQEDSDDENISTEEEDEVAEPAIIPAPVIRSSITSDGRYHNKQRLLLLSSRGVTARYRHLLEDLRTLIPHSKKESKLDVGKNYSNGSAGGGYGAAVNEIAEVRGCHTALFLECRKKGQDGYLWLGRTSHANSAYKEDDSGNISKKQLMIAGGPSVKFHITNIHTMDELKLTGNCMKGSRPVLSFDKAFDTLDHLKIVKHLMVDVFGTPRGHPKSKPFVDRVMGFYYADGKIWVRNYQIMEEAATTAKEAHAQKKLTGQTQATSLIEIGPRFVLNPIRIFRGSFGGQTLWQNDEFVNPNAIRALEKKKKGEEYVRRKGAERQRKRRKEAIVVPEDPLAHVF